MSSLQNKLTQIQHLAPESFQERLASVIQRIADATPPVGVTSKDIGRKPQVNPLDLLQKNADDFVVLVKPLTEKDDLRRHITELNDEVQTLDRTLQKVSKELLTALSAGITDEKEKGKVAGSELAEFARSLGTMSKELSNLQQISSTMKQLAGKPSEQKKHTPVEHKEKKKELKPKKDEDKKESGKAPETKDNTKQPASTGDSLKQLQKLVTK